MPGISSPDTIIQPFPAPPPERPLSNGCAQVDAMDRQTAAIVALTAELKTAHELLAPAAVAITDLGTAQKKLCGFLVTHRLKLVASVPVVLATVGALSPNLAYFLAQLLKAWGVR